MIDGLKPYKDYLESGSAWLGAVPAHWTIRSLGSLVRPISLRGRPDLPLLSVVREKGVIPRASMSDDENHNYVPDDLSNYKVVRRGNLVINKMKAWQGSMGVATQDGVVSPAYYVFDLKVENLRYAHALLRSKPYVAFWHQSSDGVRIGQWDLSPVGMKRIPIAVPPFDEQAAIVRFLDHADRRIRRYIRAKRKLIALLSEKKQAIIHRAVTGACDFLWEPDRNSSNGRSNRFKEKFSEGLCEATAPTSSGSNKEPPGVWDPAAWSVAVRLSTERSAGYIPRSASLNSASGSESHSANRSSTSDCLSFSLTQSELSARQFGAAPTV